MHFQISWNVFLKVKNEHKAMKILKQFEISIEQKLLNIQLQPYWKESSLIDARFITHYEEEMDIEHAVFDVLQRVHKVSYTWLVSKPQNISAEKTVWAFEGTSNNSRIIGIDWLQFILETKTIKNYGWSH